MSSRLYLTAPVSAGLVLALCGQATGQPAGPFPAVVELSSLDGSNGFVINGIDSGDRSGNSVSSAGDVNGDGFGDLIIGAPSGFAVGDFQLRGESYVIFGGPAAGGSGTVELSSLDGTDGFVLNGCNFYDSCGSSVASGGDVNGDGYDDLIVGAPLAGSDTGKSYVVFGGPNVGLSGVVDVSGLDGTNGFELNAGSLDKAGSSVSTAGDVNGDGFDDLIVGAPSTALYYATNRGTSFVVFGAADVGSSGAVAMRSLDGTDGFVINGANAYDRSGGSVASAGDVNGDTFDDLIIGAEFAHVHGDFAAGESYVVYGGPSVGSSGAFALSSLNGGNGFVMRGVDNRDYSGRSVSSAGDVNNDGFADVLVGAPQADPDGRADAGQSYVVFGGAGVHASGVVEFDSLHGSLGFILDGLDPADGIGASVSSAGDVNDDDIDDLIIGAPFDDANGSDVGGQSYVVFGGAGLGSSGSVDLSALDGTNGFVIKGIVPGDASGIAVSSASDVNGDGVGDVVIGATGADPNGVFNAGQTFVVFGRASEAEPCPGDATGDGLVGTGDLLVLLANWGMSTTNGASNGDFDGSGSVGTADLLLLLQAYGTSCP
jgi:hypothetical protein